MTLAEFKAWFEGFTETLEAAPNEKQWERIKARVAEIDGAAITKTVFVERYHDVYRRWWETPMVYGSSIVGCSASSSLEARSSVSLNAGAGEIQVGAINHEVFSPMSAMTDLGKAEFRSLDS